MVALVGDAEQHRVWALNLATSTVAIYDLLFAPSGFDGLRGSAAFLISGRSDDARRVITMQGTDIEGSFVTAQPQPSSRGTTTCQPGSHIRLPDCLGRLPTPAGGVR